MQLIEVHAGTSDMHRVFRKREGAVSQGIAALDVSPVYLLLDHWNPLWCFVSTEVNLHTIFATVVDMVWDMLNEDHKDYIEFPNGNVSAEALERFHSKNSPSELLWTDYLGFNSKELYYDTRVD